MEAFYKGKVVMVTGASSGIGKALAWEALVRGAYVGVCARDKAKLERSFSDLGQGEWQERLLFCSADVSKEEDCARFVAETTARWGRIDVLINNAGMSMRALFEDLDLDVLKRVMDTNFWGTVYMIKYALPYILQSKGSIAGISSIAGYRGLPARTGYSSSKFAMQGFLESLRTELLPTGVSVMWAAPGFTASNIRNVALGAGGRAQQETPLDESKLMSAERCAVIILKAIARKKRTSVMTLQGKMTVLMNKLFPGWMDKMVLRHFSKESGSPLAR